MTENYVSTFLWSRHLQSNGFSSHGCSYILPPPPINIHLLNKVEYGPLHFMFPHDACFFQRLSKKISFESRIFPTLIRKKVFIAPEFFQKTQLRPENVAAITSSSSFSLIPEFRNALSLSLSLSASHAHTLTLSLSLIVTHTRTLSSALPAARNVWPHPHPFPPSHDPFQSCISPSSSGLISFTHFLFREKTAGESSGERRSSSWDSTALLFCCQNLDATGLGGGGRFLAEGVGLEGGSGVTVRFGRPAFLNKEGGYKIWVKHFTFTSHSRFLQS